MRKRLWLILLASIVGAGGMAITATSPQAEDRKVEQAPAKAPSSRKISPAPGPQADSNPESETSVVRGPVEIRRGYEISIGGWFTFRFSTPEWLDLEDVADRVRSGIGLLAILGVAVFLSENRHAISRRVVFWGIGLQWAFALLALRLPVGIKILERLGNGVNLVLGSAMNGSRFLFGDTLANNKDPAAFIFAFHVLPTVIFVSALFAVLYHLGIMQWIVRGLAFVMAKLMGTSGAESLNVGASLFLGQTEAPLTIRPFLPRLTRSELLTVMTSGMAHVSGGVILAYTNEGVKIEHIITAVIMTAPGSILISKMLVPETEKPETMGQVNAAEGSTDSNVLDAAARGTRDGLHLALNIGAMLIAFIGLVTLVNLGLSQVGTSLQKLLGFVMAPVAYMLGVPWRDIQGVGMLLGTRTVLNEMLAFKEMGKMIVEKSLMDRSVVIASFALCGFANFSSIGIQLGGIGALAPERRHDLARLGMRALLAGTLANFLSACIAGILL